jgi:hypothetical protein
VGEGERREERVRAHGDDAGVRRGGRGACGVGGVVPV